MTDPFSVASGAVGIISLGLSVTKALYDFIQNLANAREEIDALTSNVTDLQSLLERLSDIFSSEDARPGGLDGTLVEKQVVKCTDGLLMLREKK